jgi:TPR repeat protein
MSESQQYERGLEAFRRGQTRIGIRGKLERVDSPEFDEAWKLLLPLAESGFAQAQTLVACMYDLGLGTEPSAPEAARWYELAADQGDGGAASNLCTLHQTGRFGVPFDEREVRRWWKRATELGFNTRAPYPGDDAPI